MKPIKFLSLILLCCVTSVVITQYIPSRNGVKNSSVTLQEVQKMGTLVTARLIVQTAIPYEKQNTQFGVNIGKTTFVYLGKGYALAGIPLSKITQEDITLNGDVVIIKLPKPEIVEINLNLNKSGTIAYRKDWFAPDGANLIPEAQKASIRQIASFICKDSEILEIANKQAVSILDFINQKSKYPMQFQATSTDEKYCNDSVNKALKKQ